MWDEDSIRALRNHASATATGEEAIAAPRDGFHEARIVA